MTHRRTTDQLSENYVVQFAEDETENDHYGNHIWTLITKLNPPSEELIAFAANFYATTKEEAEELVNPSRIVSSAGVWDDEQFVFELGEEMEFGRIPYFAGVRTDDGAVVLDRQAVEMTYHKEEE